MNAQFFKVLGVGVKSKRAVIPANNSYDIRYYNAMIAIDGLNGACWGIGIFGKNYTDVNWLIPKSVDISVNRDTYSSVTKVVNNSTSDVKLYVIMFDDGGY